VQQAGGPADEGCRILLMGLSRLCQNVLVQTTGKSPKLAVCATTRGLPGLKKAKTVEHPVSQPIDRRNFWFQKYIYAQQK
jgi:hypothetical protein